MEEILKELMTSKCVSMHDSNYRCYGKRCTGQCAQFQITLQKLHEYDLDHINFLSTENSPYLKINNK